jgi:hypothetical protein
MAPRQMEASAGKLFVLQRNDYWLSATVRIAAGASLVWRDKATDCSRASISAASLAFCASRAVSQADSAFSREFSASRASTFFANSCVALTLSIAMAS